MVKILVCTSLWLLLAALDLFGQAFTFRDVALVGNASTTPAASVPVDNILAWWRSTDGVTTTVDAQPVDSWTNAQGVIASASASFRPTYYTNRLDGYPAITYATGKKMIVTAMPTLFGGTNRMVAIIYKKTSAAANYLFSQGTSAEYSYQINSNVISFRPSTTIISYGIGVPYNRYNLLVLAREGATYRTFVNGFLTGYLTNGNTGGVTGTNDFGLGNTYQGSLPLIGDLVEFLVADGYSQTSVDGIYAYYTNRYPSLASSSKYVIFDGDSLTQGYGTGITSEESYPALCLQMLGIPNYMGCNFGIQSQTTTQMLIGATAKIDPVIRSNSTVYVAWEGINSIVGGVSSNNIANTMSNLCLGRKNLGAKVVVMTTLPFGTATGAQEQTRKNFNTLIRSNYTTYADVLCDIATDSVLAPTGESYDATNSTYFQTDTIHLKEAGYAQTALVVSNSIIQISWP